MPIKDTQETYLFKVKQKWGDRYDLSQIVYIRSIDKIRVGCYEHGFWEPTAGNFLSGKGCSVCGRDKLAELFTSSQEEFLQKAQDVHGAEKYDYSLVKYKGNKQHVKIRCKEHGEWEQLPSNHLKGYGCITCAANQRGLEQRMTNDEYIKRLRDVHGDRYDYSLVSYQGLSRRVDVICYEHGKFSMFANVHLGCKTSKPADCPKCAKYGYNKAEPGILYVLSDGAAITKVGITNKRLFQRVKAVSKSSGSNFVVCTSYHADNGEVPDIVETLILKELRGIYKQPSNKFDGCTECFLNVDRPALLNRIEELISQQSKEHHSSNNQAAQAA